MTALPGGSWAALPTPFTDDDRLDTAALAALARRHVAHGTAALVVCGSTGEAQALDAGEQAEAIATVAAAIRRAGARMPVVAGCTASATRDAMAAAERAARAGADALLCAAPPYARPTQEGIRAHIRAVAHASGLPVILYDVPSRTGVAIADETVARLAADGHIVALKDATVDLSRPPRLARACGGALLQFTGDDATAAAYRAMGGHGCISVTANVAPALCADLHAAWASGCLAAFARLRDTLDPLHAALFAEANPIPLKAALAALGLCGPRLRLPLTRASETTTNRLAPLLADIARLEGAAARARAPAPCLALAV
jgi:4-hydroxy-tetrahydrodipicolinate synthase